MKTATYFPLIIASALLLACGRKNKVEKEVIVYHDAACDVDTSTMAAHDIIQGDAAIAAHHVSRYHGTAAAAYPSTSASSGETRQVSYYSRGTTVSNPQGKAAVTYKRPPDATDPEVGMDEFDRKHTTEQYYDEPKKPGVTGTSATQAAGTGTSAGRKIN